MPATFTVNTLADTVDVDPAVTSLREAITAANSQAGDDIVDFSVTGTINLTGGLPDLNSNLRIQGPGPANLTVRRDTGGDYGIFAIVGGPTVKLDGLTVSNGVGDSGGGIANLGGTLTVINSAFAGNVGGGIYNTGTLTVGGSTFGSNTGVTLNSLGTGGTPYSTLVGSGIYNANGGVAMVSGTTFSHNSGSGIFNTGSLTVGDSTFSDNQAGAGGGIFSLGGMAQVNNSTFLHNSATGLTFSAGGGICSFTGGTLTVSNSTFSDNQAGYDQTGQPGSGRGDGGGISVVTGVQAEVSNSTFSGNKAFTFGGGIFQFQATLTVTNSTLSGNSATINKGGGIYGPGSKVKNTIIAGNTAPEGPDFAGGVTSEGYNLIGNTSGSSGFGAIGDLVGVDPMLAPLGNYGGPTQTMAPLPGSPAIDAGSNALVPAGVTTDQRGLARFIGTVDIGAFEVQAVVTQGDDTITVGPGTQAGTVKVTINNTTAYDNLAVGVSIDGLGGSDAYTVNLGSTGRNVNIADTGTDGTDTLTVNGTAQDDTLAKDSGFIQWRLSGDTVYRQEVDFDGMEGVTLNAGAGNDTINDPNSGNFLILGGPGDDTIIIADTTGPVTVDGGDGSDTYIIQAGNLHGPVTINDTGTTGTNNVSIVGTAGPDTFTQSGNQVTANGATITLGAGVSSLTIDGGGGTGDTFTVIGTPTITPTVQGVSDAIVMGTAGNDTIVITPVGNTGRVRVTLNGTLVGTFHPAGKLIVHGLAGDDDIRIDGGVTIPCWLYGGAGNDRLKGGGGHNVLLGGSGDDLLTGGNDRDLLIGGTGSDRLVGSAADDILIAGSTDYDASDAALAAILAEWTRTDRTYDERYDRLLSTGVGAGGAIKLDATTVHDDGVQDVLTGGAGLDWFLANLNGGGVNDKITDLKAAEFANDLDFILAP